LQALTLPHRYGFVTFSKIEDAVKAFKAMNGVALNGRAIALDFYRPRQASPSKTNVRSSNLSNGTSPPTNSAAVRLQQTLDHGVAQRTNGSRQYSATSAGLSGSNQRTGNHNSKSVPVATPTGRPGISSRTGPHPPGSSGTAPTKSAPRDRQPPTLNVNSAAPRGEHTYNVRNGGQTASSRKRVPRILTERDTEAQAAWRRRDQPASMCSSFCSCETSSVSSH